MKASGNGNVNVCAENLLKMVKGENPFDRLKGLDARSFDKDESTAKFELETAAQWNIDTYEPRAVVEDIEVIRDSAEAGNFKIAVKIKDKQ